MVLSSDVIGYDDDVAPSWCWIDPDIDNQVMWQYIAGKLWEILAFITILILYGMIKYALRKHVGEEICTCKFIRQNLTLKNTFQLKRMRTVSISSDRGSPANSAYAAGPRYSQQTRVIVEANRKLTFVPLVFLLCRMWGTIRFIMGAHFPDAIEDGRGNWIIPLQVVSEINTQLHNIM